MGYYTRFNLLMIQNPFIEDGKIIADLRSNNDCAERALDEFGNAEEAVKWYEHEKEMKQFSKKYPNTIFCLHGEGEESEDIWNKYFCNGKVQVCRAKIVFDPFNEKKLK